MIGIRDLKVSYNGMTVLRVDQLDLPDRCVCALVGRNGSGKSTLLKALVGVVPSHGMITVDGDDLRSMSHLARARRMAYLPQSLSAPDMSVATLVAHGRYARLHGISRTLGTEDRNKVAEALELTDTTGLADRLLPELSGGELQRAYLAMVIAQDTGTLLLDEPEAHLDVEYREDVWRIVRKLAHQGRCVVMASHDLPETFSMADEIVVIHSDLEGISQVAIHGSPDDLIAMPELLRTHLGYALERLPHGDFVSRFGLVR